MQHTDFLVNKDQKLKDSDITEYMCKCGNTGLKRVGKAKVSIKKHGSAFTCIDCLNKKKAESKKIIYSRSFLSEAGVIDTTERAIQAREMVLFACRCGVHGERKWTDAQKAKKLYGQWYQCKDCRKETVSKPRSGEWLERTRAAAQSEEKKQIARDNGKKRLHLKNLKGVEDHWDFKGVDVQMIPGHEGVEGVCRQCNVPSVKPLKKFIELISTKTRGCANCREQRKSSKVRRKKATKKDPTLDQMTPDILNWIKNMGLNK